MLSLVELALGISLSQQLIYLMAILCYQGFPIPIIFSILPLQNLYYEK